MCTFNVPSASIPGILVSICCRTERMFGTLLYDGTLPSRVLFFFVFLFIYIYQLPTHKNVYRSSWNGNYIKIFFFECIIVLIYC